MPTAVPPDGPIPARIMLVGEAPGAEEELRGRPFVGASGAELDRMLHDAGIARSECFVTNVCRVRPPNNDLNNFIAKAKKDRTPAHVKVRDKWVTKEIVEGLNLLYLELETVRPNVVVALGNTSLWALTGITGITKWRGSMLHSDILRCNTHGRHVGATGCSDVNPLKRTKVIPTIHPASVLREWKQRPVVVHDLRRAARFKDGSPYPKPAWNFTIRPSFQSVIDCLDRLYVRANHPEPLRISFDLETRAGHIACAGLAWSATEAICIPFMVAGVQAAWSEDQETEILWRLYSLLTHGNVKTIGQNLLYDCQYTWKHWGFVPNVDFDTMIAQHSVFSDMPKALGFLASMYCDFYVYWKDEGKNI